MSKPPKHESFLRDLLAWIEQEFRSADKCMDYQEEVILLADKHGETSSADEARERRVRIIVRRYTLNEVLVKLRAEISSPAAQVQDEVDAEAVEAAYARHEAGKPYPKEETF